MNKKARLLAVRLLVALAIIFSAQVQAQTATPATASPTSSASEKDKTIIRPPSTPPEGVKSGPIVREVGIEYVGPHTVSREIILSNMRTTVGQPYSSASVEEDVKNLYATGFFTNLRIYDEPLADGVKVNVIVQPKPTVKEVIVIGAKRIKEKAIRKKISIKVGDPLSEQKVSADAQAVRDYYQDKNFKDAQVEYKIDINEQLGRAVVTFTIVENRKQIVKDIVFEGVKAFTAKQLRKVMKTKTENWLSFINKSGRLKDEQFQNDLKLLQQYYFDHGYIDMQVKDVKYEPFDEDALRIHISIFEGIQYQVGKIRIESNKLFTTDQIRGHMKMLEGSVYSPKGLDADIKAIKDLYGEKGYIDANATPRREPNVESGKMDLVYTVTEGPQYFVEQIVIQGNNRTKDKVLRRELALSPGDVYDTVRADASKERLENLGYFSKVDISPQDAGVPGRRNMVVTVEEKRTGSITFGAGFSTVDSLLGFVELSQGNFDISKPWTFTGAGQKFKTRLQYGLLRRDATASFTEPWFLNQKLSAGVDLFYHDSQYQSTYYNESDIGGALRIAKALNDFWTIGMRYQLEDIDIYNISSDASEAIWQEAGNRSKSSVRGSLSYDTRDNLFLTRKGEKVEFFAEGAGGPLMGDTKDYTLGINGEKYFLLPYDLIFTLSGSSSVVNKYDNATRVPIFDRLFIGGSRSIRGFDYNAVGPRDDLHEPIGGLTMAYANAEMTYPIIDRVRGAIFADAGFDNANAYDFNPDAYNMGVGFGFRLNLPIGPIRLDFGFPIVYNRYNKSDFKFHFDAGYQF